MSYGLKNITVKVVLKMTEAWDSLIRRKELSNGKWIAWQTTETRNSESPREKECVPKNCQRTEGRSPAGPFDLSTEMGTNDIWACSLSWSWVQGYKPKASSAPHLLRNKTNDNKRGEKGGCEQCKTCGGAAGQCWAERTPGSRVVRQWGEVWQGGGGLAAGRVRGRQEEGQRGPWTENKPLSPAGFTLG